MADYFAIRGNGRNHTEPFSHIETECSPCGNYFPKNFVVKKAGAEFTTMEAILQTDPRTNYSHAQYGQFSMEES